MTQTTVDRTRRWKTCLHEAGHVVAAKRLLGHATGAVVFDDGSGAAYVGGEEAPVGFKDARVRAAGPAAEKLADQYPPPDMPVPVPLEVAYPETAGPLKAEIPTLLSDAEIIARWCIQGHEAEPNLWTLRHGFVTTSAEDYLAEHQQEVVEIATVLFGRGILVLPAGPAKGDAHVG
jgi:hypothetical protein